MSTPVDYPSAIYSPELQPKDHAFLLYSIQIGPGNPQENQRPIPGGSNAMINWKVNDGPGPDAKLVARLQGIYNGGDTTADLVFSDNRYPSSLKIFGNIDDTNELAIVGGTGEFVMAQGIVKTKYFQEPNPEGVIREFLIRVMVPNLQKTVSTLVTKDGPWGGNGGNVSDLTELPQHLESVTIACGDVIDSLAFSYIDQAGQRRTAGPWGGPGGLNKQTINLGPTETVTKIAGTTGEFQGQAVVTCITITTNLRTYGPFGKEKGNRFGTADGNIVVGFYVRAGVYVDNLGVYVRKN